MPITRLIEPELIVRDFTGVCRCRAREIMMATGMIANPRGRIRLSGRRCRDRRARLLGLGYLVAAAGIAVIHDELLRLPPGWLAHDCEQAALAVMIVIGMLGGLLLLEGGKLFDEAYSSSPHSTHSKCHLPPESRKPAAFDSSILDTRSGVAMLRTWRAIGDARSRRNGPDIDMPDRHHPAG